MFGYVQSEDSLSDRSAKNEEEGNKGRDERGRGVVRSFVSASDFVVLCCASNHVRTCAEHACRGKQVAWKC